MRASLLVLLLLLATPLAAACDGLSPGDQILVEGASCTLGFLVADPTGLYFTTAGHCIREGQVASNPDHGDIGVGAFRFLDPDTGQPTDGQPGKDFALIRLDPALYDKLNPKICGWDGPKGIYRETPGGGEVRHYGHGVVFGEFGPTTQQRQGYNLWTDLDAFTWAGMGVPGDSGSAVITADGLALGVLTHVIIAPPDTNGGTHLDKGFALAAEKGFRLRLVLAGEDPRAVLAQVQGGAPASAEPTTGSAPATPAPQGNATAPAPGGNSTAPANATAPREDGAPIELAPAATDGDGAEARTPMPPLVFVLGALAAALLLRRARG